AAVTTNGSIPPPVAMATGMVALLLMLGIMLGLMTGRFPGKRKPPVVAVGLITDYTKSDQELGRPLADMLATDLARSPGLQVISTARMYDLLGKSGPSSERGSGLSRGTGSGRHRAAGWHSVRYGWRTSTARSKKNRY